MITEDISVISQRDDDDVRESLFGGNAGFLRNNYVNILHLFMHIYYSEGFITIKVIFHDCGNIIIVTTITIVLVWLLVKLTN